VQDPVDIGFGDTVTPGPVESVYPVLLDDLPAPRLLAYPTYTVVAEKLHAIALLGMTNSRLEDYFDLAMLLGRETLAPDLLVRAIKATFERRDTIVPEPLPIGLSEDEASSDIYRLTLQQTSGDQLATIFRMTIVVATDKIDRGRLACRHGEFQSS